MFPKFFNLLVTLGSSPIALIIKLPTATNSELKLQQLQFVHPALLS